MPVFSTPEPLTLRLHLPAGSAEVTADAVATTTVELRPCDESDPRARKAVERSRIELSGDVLVVHVPNGHGRGSTPALQLVLRLPEDSRIDAELASADLRCAGRLAGVRVKAASGDVVVEEVTGEVSVNTASGGIRVGHAQSGATVRTASGAVDLVRSDGDVDVSVASGDVLVRSAGGSVHARSASGDVEVGSAANGSLSVVTASGDVRVGVASGTGVWLDLSSGSGKTASELPVEADTPAGVCTLNIKVRTASGDILVRRAG